MGGPNLEVFKARIPIPSLILLRGLTISQFGFYILFPIGIMYYFGTNLDKKFSVPDFWPSPESLHKIPTEKEDINAELERLKAKRLAMRQRRLAAEANEQAQAMQPVESMPVPHPAPVESQREGGSWSQAFGFGKK
jgi:protein PET100, fungi type